MEPRIVHLDDRIAIVSKPSGMFVHPSDENRRRERTLLSWLRDRLDHYVYPVHRIDRASSGLVALARDPDSARDLQAALQSAHCKKDYLAFSRGETEQDFLCDLPLKVGEKKVSRPAKTFFKRLMISGGFSLLKARLETGRRHQIRRHLALLGHQIVGDSTYGKGRINNWLRNTHGLPRLFLHSWRLSLPLLDHSRILTFEDPLPADLLIFLRSFTEDRELWPGGIPQITPAGDEA
ncbi:MAG: pseudouridine synthase [Planctomycetota bacterium]